MSDIHSQTPQYFRTIFLSDFHIGAKTFNADALLDFLRKTESQSLYLVGDIIDGWKLHKRWYWNETISQIFDELFRKAHQGTKIIYITGNHDERVRELSLLKRLRYSRRLNVQIKNRVIHRTADGHDFLVIHGDQFDRALLRGRVSRWSDKLYDLVVSRFGHDKGPMIEIEGKTKRFSLAKFLSYHGQIALNILNNYERSLCREARRSDVEGIICGHTHIAANKKIGAITYANCGAWLKGQNTAIVENDKGRIELIEWPYNKDTANHTLNKSHHYRPLTTRLVSSIRRTWPSPHDASVKDEPLQMMAAEPSLSV